MIDLAAVDALVAVARTGSVHAAAGELGFTPSAVSQQVKRLERDLGAPLLERAGRGVVLTAAGRRMVDEGGALREQVESLRARLHDARSRPTGTIRLGAFATAVRGLVPQLIVEARRQHPDLRVTVTELDPWDAVDAVSAGTLDLVLVHHWEGVGLALAPNLASDVLLSDVADVLLPADDPLAGRASVTPEDVRERTWACTPDGTICYEWFCHMYRGDRPPPRIDFRCLEFASQVELVAAGAAVALVPRLGRGTLPPQVVAVPVVDPVPTRPVSLVWRASMTTAPAVRALREVLTRPA
ncbi:LysR family transcriptional regulator [Microbacterium fluvii]|uniref:LysR family transcriptional regulator n=1 Tax=Microbacterium fluvii TaxID=415215 RepID=A0ABW2HHQ7_9MICO|nr:LysR family transcriptional regulator [Microbacterium fluvii]MCU4672898.1 LysR family transcriptional regulator [Microbacterium fluvii]